MAFSSSRGFGPAPEGTSQNFPPRVPNSFEPLRGSARLISRTGQQGQELTAPIGAHAPPIPCADQSDPPGFPRPGGSVFCGAPKGRTAPFRPRCASFATVQPNCIATECCRSCGRAKRFMIGGSDSVCNSGTTDVRAQSVVACACL